MRGSSSYSVASTARTPSFFLHKRETKASVSAPAPAPASSKRTTSGNGPNKEAIKAATGAGVRNCPSSPCRCRGADMAAVDMESGYQTRHGSATGESDRESDRKTSNFKL